MMTIQEILDAAPDKIKRMPKDTQIRWAEKQFAIQNDPARLAKIQQEQADAADKAAIKADTFVQNFISMTPAQVSTYVDNNTATLAQTRVLLNKMALMLLALARREYR